MEIRETALTDEVLATLIGFSKDWEAENSKYEMPGVRQYSTHL